MRNEKASAPTPPSIHLYLARHGRTHWNQLGRFQGLTDVPLDDVGRAQASTLADALRGHIEAVITSDLQRASETARIVADTLGIPLLREDPDLRERGYGVFEGLTRQECMERFPEAWAARERERDHEPPGGEPRAQVIARMQRGLARAVATLHAHPEVALHASTLRSRAAEPRALTEPGAPHGRRALIVGHGSSLRMFLEVLTRAPVVSIANMEYREVRHDGRGFALVSRRTLARASEEQPT